VTGGYLAPGPGRKDGAECLTDSERFDIVVRGIVGNRDLASFCRETRKQLILQRLCVIPAGVTDATVARARARRSSSSAAASISPARDRTRKGQSWIAGALP